MSTVDLQGSSSSNYGLRPELPPLPSNPSKFSSIAKSAGKRIAKKFQYIRRASLDHIEVLSSSLASHRGSSTSLSQSSRSGTPVSRTGFAPLSLPSEPVTVARPIARPTIPPPAPPPQVTSTRSPVPPSSQPSLPPVPPRSQPSLPPVPPVPSNPNSIYKPEESTSRFDVNDDDDDDFDDSDFYDSDSELIRNFVAAVQPIYSMEEEPLYQYYTYGISLQV